VSDGAAAGRRDPPRPPRPRRRREIRGRDSAAGAVPCFVTGSLTIGGSGGGSGLGERRVSIWTGSAGAALAGAGSSS